MHCSLHRTVQTAATEQQQKCIRSTSLVIEKWMFQGSWPLLNSTWCTTYCWLRKGVVHTVARKTLFLFWSLENNVHFLEQEQYWCINTRRRTMFLHGALDTKSVQWQQVVQIQTKSKFVQDISRHVHVLSFTITHQLGFSLHCWLDILESRYVISKWFNVKSMSADI